MQFIEISQCKTINFKPLKPWPKHLPSISVRNNLIAGFDSSRTLAVQLDIVFEDALTDCYQKLTLPELARLYKIKPDLRWDFLCDFYHFRWNSDLKNIFELLTETPPKFQNWASEKDLGIKDLSPLKLSIVSPQFLEHITRYSKQIGCKVLEWGIELSEHHSSERILQNSENTERWYHDIFSLRHPITASRDQNYTNRVISTPWPRQVDAQWKRVGDKAGIEVRFISVSSADFQKKSEALVKLQSKVEKIWNPN